MKSWGSKMCPRENNTSEAQLAICAEQEKLSEKQPNWWGLSKIQGYKQSELKTWCGIGYRVCVCVLSGGWRAFKKTELLSDKRKKQIEAPIALVFGVRRGVEMAGWGGIMTILPLLLGTAQCTLSLALHLGREQRGKYIRNSGSGGGGWVCPFSYSMNFLAPVQLPWLSVDELLIMELYVLRAGQHPEALAWPRFILWNSQQVVPLYGTLPTAGSPYSQGS